MKKIGKKIFKIIGWLGLIIAIMVTGILLFTKLDPAFGGQPDAINNSKIAQSKNFDGTGFVNLEDTNVMRAHIDPYEPTDQVKGLKSYISPDKNKNPKQVLPSVVFDKDNWENGDFSWLGHSTIVTQVDHQNILFDPVFYEASPVSFFGKPFELEHKTDISDLPPIDIVLISHDHYDHLDMQAIKELNLTVKKFLVPVGIGAHLKKWGIADKKIVEFDWYESAKIEDTNFVFTPARHFSGRGILGRNNTLWGSWVIQGETQKIYFSGDSGYAKEFVNIGKKYGPFDIAFVESGAYSGDWAEIHMLPEQAVQAGIDVQAKILFPIHWGKFDLAYHKWNEPIKRFVAESAKKNTKIATPIIGEIFNLTAIPQKKWWEF